MTAAKCYAPQVYLFLSINLSIGLASYWLIPHFGLLGAILAIFVGVIVQLVGSVLILFMGMGSKAPIGSNHARLA
jgi:hypothetical protein